MVIKKLTLLGVSINPISINELNKLISEMIFSNRERRIIANHNLHSIYSFHHSGKMRDFYKKASVIHIDGMSLIFLSKLFGHKLCRQERVTYVDWIRPLMRLAAQNKWRVFFLGSKPGVAEKAARRLKSELPDLQIMTSHGYFDISRESPENREKLRLISDYKPHLLMVGMGMPRQEEWIINNYGEISSNVILTAGACMDYIAGAIRTPPRWLGRIGLEWLYRLLGEPRRLWRRYLLEPLFIIKLIFHSQFKRQNIKF